jgi:hypothetical protein
MDKQRTSLSMLCPEAGVLLRSPLPPSAFTYQQLVFSLFSPKASYVQS